MIGSLRMLTASIVIAIPMDSTKLFQNAMESGKHSDKNYKYQEDEKNYYNSDEGDNRYSPDYNYYQYYQPIQQHQSGYNNNNYGYDNDYKDKRIS